MDLKLSGKIAFISGSTQGIGYATAKLLAQENAIVIINGRDQQKVNDKVAQIKKETGNQNISGIAADLATVAGCEKIIATIKHVDILINNLGIFEPVPFEKITEAQWQEMFNTNIMSGARLSKKYLLDMLARDWGRIIFISSESAYQTPKEMIHYGMTKTAQLALSRGIAELTKGTRVTCNAVILGPSISKGVVTFIQELADQEGITFQQMEQEFFQNIRPTSLLQRFTKPEEIANLIVYTSSPLSSATNGAVLHADAGVVQSAL